MKELEIFLRKILLKALLFFYGGKHSSTVDGKASQKNCFIIRLNRIGDALITTPLLKLIKEKCGCKTIVLADKKNRFVFENNPHVDELIIFKKGLKGFWEIRNYFKTNKVDVLIDSHDDVSTTVSFIAALSGVEKRFALAKGNENIYTETISRKDATKFHIAERVAEISKLCGAEYSSDEIELVYKPKDDSLLTAAEFLEKNASANKFTIGVNISAGSDARFWGVEKFKKLIKHIRAEYDVNLILLRAPNDSEKAELISEGLVPVFNDKSFDQFAAMISKLDLLITPDTSAVHLAAAFGVPAFGLYVHYNTNDVIWYPYNTKYEAVVTKKPNLSDIEFDDVVIKFDKFLTEILESK